MEKIIKITIAPENYVFNEVKKKINDFLKSHGFSKETVLSQIVIIKELIRNALECGKLKPSEDEMTVHVLISNKSITVELKNPIDDTSSSKLKELDKTIQLIRGYQDPFEAYSVKIKEVSKNSLGGGAYGLGLAKIACERNAIIDFFVSEDNILNMSATRSYESDFKR